ncbi:acyl-CoA N-acyltransferase [Xylariaceae sp. FL0255]|nr:acyl-CoA N-acyltransferase [Xylariaceae sp. FL0255]
MTTTKFLENNYKSDRLIYKTVENDEETEEFILREISNDAISAALAEHGVIRPKGKKLVQELIDSLMRAELGVIIYLPQRKDVPIGYLGLGWGGKQAASSHHRDASIGLVIAAAYQDKGYGSEAINWALDWAFRLGGYHRVEIGTVSFNERAMHVYKGLGFVEEGRSREAHWFDRKWHDMVSYGMLESEWAALRGLEGGTAN